MDSRRLTTEEKALKINLDRTIYGSFAEIGAGQEVAANFFKAGGSSGTIAYSHSAYDMKVSDTLYGHSGRYVCEERVVCMLDTDFKMVNDRLPEKANTTCFFSFANTVESLNYHKTNQGQGWIGLRFQLTPNSKPNDVVLHVKMHDNSIRAQQEALGILGVNLIHACFFIHEDMNCFLDSIVHRLSRDRIEIDMLRVSGSDFEHIDNRILALNLVKKGLTEATMFDLKKQVLQPKTALYKKNVFLMRGRFRPVTHVHVDMIESSKSLFLKEEGVKEEKLEVVFELTLKDLTADGKISDKDFIDRAELLCSLGYTVMISNYLKYYKVVDYLAKITKGYKIGMILGIYNVHTIFDEKYYGNLPGGLLEAFGKGFGHNVKMWVYPALDVETGEIYHFDAIELDPLLEGLKKYMIDNNKIESVSHYNPKLLHIHSDDVLSKIKSGTKMWEEDVPEKVVKAIKTYNLFGYKKPVFSN